MNPYLVLRNRFPAEEYVLLAEVADNVSTRSRRLDFMIINLWQSRGLAITGIERKSNRADWLNEKKNPQKQEAHFKHCDYFYLLTDKENVAKIEEIPETWGWYHITEKGVLKTIKQAPKLQSEPIARALLCEMLRRAQDKSGFIHKDEVQDYIKSKAEEISTSKNNQLIRDSENYLSLAEKVKEFEKHSGISINHTWGGDLKDIGEAVKMIKTGSVQSYLDSLNRIGEQVKRINEGIAQKIDYLNTNLSK